MKKADIFFADFSHTGVTIDTNYIPLGVGYVAAYAKESLGDSINIEIFKYPEELSSYLDSTVPTVACFSNFSWNFKLSYEYACQIKKKYPETITVFGGPNYSNQIEKQEKFLKEHPSIDFYIIEEGEIPFLHLFNELKAFHFNVKDFVESGPPPQTRIIIKMINLLEES